MLVSCNALKEYRSVKTGQGYADITMHRKAGIILNRLS